MATTMNKNKVSDMAKDFGLTSKDILSVLSTYEDGSKKLRRCCPRTRST